MNSLVVEQCPLRLVAGVLVRHHYLHRRPPASYAFRLMEDFRVVGACTFGAPASRHAQMSVCPENPDLAIELNRLWLDDGQPHGRASWFVSRCLKVLPPRIVFSYADTAQGHHGGVYRALSWRYDGLTDRDRKTPRYDYIPLSGKHTRDAARTGVKERVRRQPKHRYWTVTGSRRDKRRLVGLCGWESNPYPANEKRRIA